MATKIWKLEITIEVDDTWVQDGYEATPERIVEILKENDLTYSHDHEYKVTAKTLSAPDQSAIRKIQGYPA